MENLKKMYNEEIVKKKIGERLRRYDNPIILGSTFVGRYNVSVFQHGTKDLGYGLLVENIRKPMLVDFRRVKHRDGYVTFKKNQLRLKIPSPLYKMLVRNGLYQTKESGFNKNNSYLLLNRLVMCLYQNIIGDEVHHIDKNLEINNIFNLLKISHGLHDKIDNMPIEEGIKVSRVMQAKDKCKIFKQPRNTLAQNPNLILELLRQNKTSTKKGRKFKICGSTQAAIKNHFFYKSEFLKLHETLKNKELSALNSNSDNMWKYINLFESLEMPENTESVDKIIRNEFDRKIELDDGSDIF